MYLRARALFSFLLLLLLTNCTTALRVTGDGDADPISGHQVGIGNPESIVDIGDVRVRLSPLNSVRKHPIPTSYAFLFSWTPKAYNRRNAEMGRRAPTQQDWEYQAALANPSGIRKSAVPRIKKIIRYQQRAAARSEFKPYVAADGTIARCNDTWGGKYGCTINFTLEKTAQMQLAHDVLSKKKPNCRIDKIDPPEILALRPGIKSGKLSIVASLACS